MVVAQEPFRPSGRLVRAARPLLDAKVPVDAQVVAVRVAPRRLPTPPALEQGAIPAFVVRDEAACPASGTYTEETFGPRPKVAVPVPNDRTATMIATQDATRVPGVIVVGPQVGHVGLHRLGEMTATVGRRAIQARPTVAGQEVPTIAKLVEPALACLEAAEVAAVAAPPTLPPSAPRVRAARLTRA